MRMKAGYCALTLLAALSVRADATAFAGVQQAVWQADFAYYVDPSGARSFALPAGIMLVCTGGAHTDAWGGCTDSRSASVTSNGPLRSKIVDVRSGYELRNKTSDRYSGLFVFDTRFSSFNPGGPEIGASVDNPGKEYASFFSVVSGPGAFDLHGCDMSSGGHSAPRLASHGCGVHAPDYSWNETYLGPLGPWSKLSSEYRIYISVAAQGADPVPESATLALLCGGLGPLALRRRFTASTRKAR